MNDKTLCLAGKSGEVKSYKRQQNSHLLWTVAAMVRWFLGWVVWVLTYLKITKP